MTKAKVRASVRARIQHIIDFLKEYVAADQHRPPHEHAIIFDEAQRAWNSSYDKQKFGRSASEPALLLEIMARHEDWAAIVPRGDLDDPTQNPAGYDRTAEFLRTCGVRELGG